MRSSKMNSEKMKSLSDIAILVMLKTIKKQKEIETYFWLYLEIRNGFGGVCGWRRETPTRF